jgi:RsmE family RNA methyltransferase
MYCSRWVNRSSARGGPEGGWASDELAWFRETGWAAASLGNTILRAETAAIVATALAMEAVTSGCADSSQPSTTNL